MAKQLIIDLTWTEFRTLPLESRRAKVEEFKARGFGILKLAKVWGVSTSAIYKSLEVSDEVPEATKITVKDRLNAIIAQMDDGVSKRLVEIAVQLLSYEIGLEKLAELEKENAQLKQFSEALRKEYDEMKSDLGILMNLKRKYTEGSNVS